MMQLLTHSRASCFRLCPRKHFIRYELGIRPMETDYALRFGSAYHAALEATDRGQDVAAAMDAYLTDPFDLAAVAAVYQGRPHGPLEVVETEREFALRLRNPETHAPSTTWMFAGKIDRIVRLSDGRLALQEYKTTSEDFTPGAAYWLRLHMDQQLSLYVIAARELGFDVTTILYDVTRRPALRPLKATPIDSRKYTKDGRLYAAQRDRDETPEEYAARIAADIAERPEHYYARIEIPRLEQDLDDCAAELWMQQRAIREAQLAGRWYRNPGSCHAYGRSCEYLHVCMHRDLEISTPDGFERHTDVHPELAGATTSEG